MNTKKQLNGRVPAGMRDGTSEIVKCGMKLDQIITDAMAIHAGVRPTRAMRLRKQLFQEKLRELGQDPEQWFSA